MMPKTPKTSISYCIYQYSNIGILRPTPAHPTWAHQTAIPCQIHCQKKYFLLVRNSSLSVPCSCYVSTNSLNAELFSPFSASCFIVMGHTHAQTAYAWLSGLGNSKSCCKILGWGWCVCVGGGGGCGLVLANGA
jgi:hypothetical protein